MSDEASAATESVPNLTPDQALRCYVLENYPYGEYEPVHVLIRGLDAVYDWLSERNIPDEPNTKTKSRSHLKPVPKPENPDG